MIDRKSGSIPPSTDPTWAGHLRATLKLGLPLIGVQLSQMAIHVTDTIMIGWLGSVELAASVLATQMFFVAFIVSTGFAHAVVPLAASAAAANDATAVRRATRMGFWAVSFVAFLMMPPLWHTETILLWLGQQPQVSALAQDYLRIAQWALFPTVLIAVLRSYFAALERAGVVLLTTLVGVAVNALLNYTFIFGNFGAPALGIEGAAISTLGTGTVMLVVLTGYTMLNPVLRRYALFVRLWRPDWTTLGEVMRMGFAISAALLAEVGLFAAASIMVGWLGTVPLAAHGIALQVISVVFMIPLGLSSAATVRAGRAVGRKDALGLDRAGKMVLGLAMATALAAGVVFWWVPEWLILMFLDETTNPQVGAIVAYGVPLLAVAALFQMVDTLQVISVGLLRGIKDIKVPMLMAVFSYWGIGVPAAYVLAFPLGLAAVGVWGGLAVGLLMSAALLTGRFLMRHRLGLVPFSA